MVIAVDFDGTCVDHRYPDIGADVPGASTWLRELSRNGAQLILWTMRSDGSPPYGRATLTEAVQWFDKNKIKLFGVNENHQQTSWTTSPKAYAHVYIDDAAFGCPLRENPRSGGRPYVDWDKVGPAVLNMLLAKKDS